MRQFLAFCAVVGMAAVSAIAQNVPTGFVVDTLVASGLPTPHDLCCLPDGRCLVACKAGEVVVVAGNAMATVGVVANVETDYERGLLSIAADPAFAVNGYVYVYYAHAGDAFLHVDRFTCSGVLAGSTSTNLQFVAGSRRVVLASLVDNSTNHNGGSLRFGPDGMLYLTCGDDGSPCNAQSVTSQAGCLWRFDVAALPAGGSSTAPAFAALDPGDNPLSANTDSSQLVLAHGLRNPWRMDIDPTTGHVYLGDVGLFTMDEVSEYVRPAVGALPLRNFGWPWLEGTAPGVGCGGTAPVGLTAPIATVGNATWTTLLVGPRYRNLGGAFAFGAAYEGDLFYADYTTGQVRRLAGAPAWAPAPAVAGQPTASEWATGFVAVTSLRQGVDGALYVTQHPGSLKRVRPLGPTNAITAISGSGQRVSAGEGFPEPLRVRVVDPQGNALAGAPVAFAVAGPATVGSGAAVTDAQGFAQTAVTALAAGGGAIIVTATTPGAVAGVPFGLFARRLTATPAASLLVLTITNQTDAVPPFVPYVVFLSFPGSPPLPTPWGTLCIHPAYPGALAIEDAFGLFGGLSLSGTGGFGAPGANLVYPVPPGLLTGWLLSFQAVGFDPVTGLFVSNCEQAQF